MRSNRDQKIVKKIVEIVRKSMWFRCSSEHVVQKNTVKQNHNFKIKRKK